MEIPQSLSAPDPVFDYAPGNLKGEKSLQSQFFFAVTCMFSKICYAAVSGSWICSLPLVSPLVSIDTSPPLDFLRLSKLSCLSLPSYSVCSSPTSHHGNTLLACLMPWLVSVALVFSEGGG